MTNRPAIPPPPPRDTVPTPPPDCDDLPWPDDGEPESGMRVIIPPGTTREMLRAWEMDMAEREPPNPWADSYALDTEAL